MTESFRRSVGRNGPLVDPTLLLGLGLPALGESSQTTASSEAAWRQAIQFAARGEFGPAADAIGKMAETGGLIRDVRTWLDEYQHQQDARKEQDRVELERYVRYAKERMERKEYPLALDQVLRAVDVAADRETVLNSDWMRGLVDESLKYADELREKRDWRGAWHVYADLGVLYEREPRYRKLENEVLTHLRLDTLFGEKSHWQERVENVQWRDAEYALELVGLAYVEPPDFKAVTEAGLEQVLLLTESKSARDRFEGLANDNDRADFKARVQELLDQVRQSPAIDRAECARRFRRVVKKIGPETVRLPEEVVVHELMRGATEALDDFTTIIWPQETDEFDKHTRGDFIGVGISIIKNQLDEVEVVTPLEDTPAYYAGIQAGDIITHVDGTSLKDLSVNKVVDTITGPQDTHVTLAIRRGEQVLEFPLVRKKVKIQSVKGWERKPDGKWNFWRDRDQGIAYLRVTNFQRNTVEDLQNAVSELRPNGLNGIILDLRWNPGGLLDSAWQMSSLFLKKGQDIVKTKGRNQGEDQELHATSDGPYADVPLVVLVNDDSASATEIVSGAIRDNARGRVIGDRTNGKFSVQNLIPLSSSSAKLKITTARYYIPSGVSLHRTPTSTTWGVEPNVPIRLSRWEEYNAYQLRRDAEMLGPKKTKDDKDSENQTAAADAESAKDQDGDDEKTAEAQEEAENKLPPLEQPDKNDRPLVDPQVDTALLVLRAKLLADKPAAVAAAENRKEEKSAQP